MKILMKYVHHACAFICKLIVSVTNRTGICPPAERPSVVSKDRLSVVPHRGLRCMSISVWRGGYLQKALQHSSKS